MDGDGMAIANRISFWLLYKHSVSVTFKMDMLPDQGSSGYDSRYVTSF